MTLNDLRERYNGCKPCLHGSDAHNQETVGQPVAERYSWIKGGLEFDALRQACIDPNGRAYVGTEPPRTAMPSQVISHVAIANADWAAAPAIPLNPGIVAIIGARGSGKTALADMIAAGCDAIAPAAWNASENISPSFLARACKLLGNASATLVWGGGASVTRFLDGRDANGHAPYGQNQQAEFRAWLKQFAHWLFDTDHISVRYEIVYDGIDIRNLSPGTRGIVLLLLYLALDDGDDRPLIIDQPEENLDPKSVFEELVALFVAAKAKRQVIMVTHNANLVINTDADQIIVADARPHPAGGLPPIAYKAGGLENAEIRKAVCDILEGGEEAFRERARRLRVRLDR